MFSDYSTISVLLRNKALTLDIELIEYLKRLYIDNCIELYISVY